jgi:hypothetical protein
MKQPGKKIDSRWLLNLLARNQDQAGSLRVTSSCFLDYSLLIPILINMTNATSQQGFDAMMNGEGEVITGWKNKLRAAIASVVSADI